MLDWVCDKSQMLPSNRYLSKETMISRVLERGKTSGRADDN